MALFEIDDPIKLWALYRAILEAKYHEDPEDKDIFGSPIVADISISVVNALKNSGFNLNGQLDWDQMCTADENSEFVEKIKDRIKFVNKERAIENKKEFIKDAFAPLTVSDELIKSLINDMD